MNRLELSILEELTYNSRTIILLFQRERIKLEQIYGNKWLLCAIINGKIQVLQSSKDRSEMENIGFELSGNILFDVLNPSINLDYNCKRNRGTNFIL